MTEKKTASPAAARAAISAGSSAAVVSAAAAAAAARPAIERLPVCLLQCRGPAVVVYIHLKAT